MSALIPIKNDPEANERAIAGVRADKEREAMDGHDRTWVAHPALLPVAMEVFDRLMPQPNRYRAYEQAATLTRELIREQRFCEFLTLPAYRRMISAKSRAAWREGAWVSRRSCDATHAHTTRRPGTRRSRI